MVSHLKTIRIRPNKIIFLVLNILFFFFTKPAPKYILLLSFSFKTEPKQINEFSFILLGCKNFLHSGNSFNGIFLPSKSPKFFCSVSDKEHKHQVPLNET